VLTERDVRELLALRTENKNLDYKQSINWGTASAAEKGAIVKDVLAMANTQDGGRIVFGVRDGDFEAVGLTEDDFQSLDATRFADFLNRYSDPLFGCGIHKFVIDGRRFAAIEVPEFSDVPIICKADLNDANNRQVLRRGATYIRTAPVRAESSCRSRSISPR
jgi:predicted HTH transcriptional regulator